MIKKIAIYSLLIAGLFSSNTFAETILRVATWLPPTSPQNDIVWPTWAKWVEDATDGRVKVDLEYGRGHPKTMFDLVEKGVVDASFSVDAYVPSRFILSQMAELPLETSDPEIASAALWKVYKTHFESANEYQGLKVLGKFVHGPGQLHTTFPVNTLADLKDKNIRTGGSIATELAKRIGAKAVSAPAPQVYPLLQQGAVDGVLFPTSEQRYLRLCEVTSHITAFPRGMYTTAFTIFMNPKIFDRLSKKDQKAIMEVSGEKLSRFAGKAWREGDDAGYVLAERKGVTITRISENDPRNIELRELAKGMDQQWIDKASVRNVDAVAALKMFRALAKK